MYFAPFAVPVRVVLLENGLVRSLLKVEWAAPARSSRPTRNVIALALPVRRRIDGLESPSYAAVCETRGVSAAVGNFSVCSYLGEVFR